jgi:hypothetical protein
MVLSAVFSLWYFISTDATILKWRNRFLYPHRQGAIRRQSKWSAVGSLKAICSWSSTSGSGSSRRAGSMSVMHGGMLMADMARHIANAHEEEYGRDKRETLNLIREAFEREIMKPTSTHSGKFSKGGRQ